jgi:hypothetical protein
MALTVADINAYVQFMMNDAGGSVYTAAVILPAIKIANDDLQSKLLNANIEYLDEEASEQDIAIGGTALTTVPTDMVEPIELHERPTTSTLLSDYVKMEYKNPLPDRTQTETLQDWTWREHAVAFIGATVARGVRLRYKKLITALANDASTVAMQHSKNYFAYRAAGHLKAFIEENPEGAGIAYNSADDALNDIIDLALKFQQKEPMRRKPFSRKFRRLR